MLSFDSFFLHITYSASSPILVHVSFQLFNADIMNNLMSHHFSDPTSFLQTLMLLETLAQARPELVKPYFMKKVLNNSAIPPEMSNAVVRISLSMTENYTVRSNYSLKLKENL